MQLYNLAEYSPYDMICEKINPSQKELLGLLYVMVADQQPGKVDEFLKEVQSIVDPEFLKKRQAKSRGIQWLSVARPGDETNAVVYGRKVRMRVLEGVIKEADISDLLVALGLDDADALRMMDQFEIVDKDYNLSALRQALRRAGGKAKDATQFIQGAETGKPATPIQPEPAAPAAEPRISATQRLARLRQRVRERERGGIRPIAPPQRPIAPPQRVPARRFAGAPASSEFYSQPNL